MLTNQVAPVASLPIYKRLDEAGLLGAYHLLIATEVAKDLDAWAEFWQYRNQKIRVGDRMMDTFIIMDNGLIETGAAADLSLIKDACDAVGATCLVLPDALGDFEGTLKLVRKHFKAFQKTGIPLMGVVQGKTVEEAESLLTFY